MVRNTRGVNTTEYALILIAIAVMVFGTYLPLTSPAASIPL
jgi:Flp pilus assembly pilin Flp